MPDKRKNKPPLRYPPEKTLVIRGDAFCVALRKVCDLLLQWIIYAEGQRHRSSVPTTSSRRALFVEILNIVRKLRAATENKEASRTYLRVLFVGKKRTVITRVFFFSPCKQWVWDHSLAQFPDKRERPGGQKSDRI